MTSRLSRSREEFIFAKQNRDVADGGMRALIYLSADRSLQIIRDSAQIPLPRFSPVHPKLFGVNRRGRHFGERGVFVLNVLEVFGV